MKEGKKDCPVPPIPISRIMMQSLSELKIASIIERFGKSQFEILGYH